MSESWLPIPGLMPYEVSDIGRIRRGAHVLRPQTTGAGYFGFSPSIGGVYVRTYIHRVVLLAFVGPCHDGLEVNHKNGIKTDNRIENLEYVTRGENIRHAHSTGLIQKREPKPKPPLKGLSRGDQHWTHTHPERVRRGEDCASSKLTAAQVADIRASVAAGERQCDVAARLGVGRPRVCRIVNREQWSHL